MARGHEDIQIKDPPLEELSKQHSCLRRTCLSCLSFLLVLLAISLLILKFTLGPKNQTIKTLPPGLTKSLPLYDTDNIDSITVTSGNERSRGVELAAFVPKLVIAPIILTLDRRSDFVHLYRPDIEVEIGQQPTTWGKFMTLMKTPVGDHRDQLRIEWNNLPADANFINEYYTTELKKHDFVISSESQTDQIRQFTFSKNDIEGNVYIQDNPATPETDVVSLTVNMEIDHKN